MTAVVESAPVEPAPPATARGRRKLWIILAAVVLLVLAVGVAVTATLRHRHYADAPSLDVEGGAYQQLGSDPGYRYVQIGDISAAVFPVRAGREVGFEIWVHNPSSVTQTILGVNGTGVEVQHNRVLISKKDPSIRGNEGPLTPGPVDIPPDAFRAVHYFWKTSSCVRRGVSMTLRDLYLRVRVGGKTRTETIPFDSEIVVVFEGTSRTCRA